MSDLKNWKEELLKIFEECGPSGGDNVGDGIEFAMRLNGLIESLLQAQKAELLEEVEKMAEEKWNYRDELNPYEVVKDILNSVKNS